MGRLLHGAENPITSVAQAGDDVGVLVQMAIAGRSDDGHVGVRIVDGGYSFWACHAAGESHDVRTGILQLGDGRNGAAACGEHRIKQQNLCIGDTWWKVQIVGFWLVGGFVAAKPYVDDSREGEKLVKPIDHAESGTENGNEKHGGHRFASNGRCQGRLDFHFAGGDVLCRLDSQDRAECRCVIAKGCGSRVFAPHAREVKRCNRVVEYGDGWLAHHCDIGRGRGA